ncbi:transcriptional regulator [Saccharothrix hoggarensis]|uniref:Transcriptional regulator n=1 Tax=Saccharothrix hoggarensis TaxID=913853 RepID=A0ABW3QIG0_9PSEU
MPPLDTGHQNATPSSHTIRLRTETFAKVLFLSGFHSDYSAAKALGVNRSTVTRVGSGELQPGPRFIAGALTALPRMRFHDLFEVVPTPNRTSE